MIYQTLKKLLPDKVRQMLKPYYQKWYLRDFVGEKLVVAHDGGQQFEIVLNRQNGAVDEYVYIHRNWEPHIGATLRGLLKPGDTFVDVGANIGYFSLLAASLVGENGRVIAFEPLASLIEQIEKSINHNKFSYLETRQCALGDTPGMMTLSTTTTNIGGSSLVSASAGENITVSVRTLDNELVDEVKVSVVKIDVEGFEYEMLHGAKTILAKHQPALIIEFSPQMYLKRRTDMARDIATMLVDLGYEFTVLQSGKKYTTAAELLEAVGLNQVDLLCTISNKEEK